MPRTTYKHSDELKMTAVRLSRMRPLRNGMLLKRWAFVCVFLSLLPWLAARTNVALAEYGPLHWGLLRPGESETLQHAALYAQWLFDALVFSVPVGALLGWCTPGRPLLLALMAMAAYSLAFLLWAWFSNAGPLIAAASYLSPNHLLLILVLGVATLGFSFLFQDSRRCP